jgi:hypothetical protein
VDDQKRQAIPVDIEAKGNILTIYKRGTRDYVGMLVQPSLAILLHNSSVVIDASLVLPPPPAPQSKRSKRTPQANASSSTAEPEIRLTVYGLLEDADGVGKTLSEADLYLQHPSPTDCSRQLRYHNPQFLIRPGREMPTLEDLSIRSSSSQDPAEHQLDEVTQARVLRIFDDAHDGASGDRSVVEPSPRLRTALKEYVSRAELAGLWYLTSVCRHQRLALSFMSDKEGQISDIPSSRSLWRISTDFDGEPT